MALRVAARQASRLICVSGVAVELLEACGVGTGKATTIHNGVDRGFLGEVPEPRPEVSGPGPHIGVFGVIEPRKGHDIFLEAASRLSQRHPTARFWVVGPVALADKAGFATRLEAMAQASALAGRVTFTGFQGDVARWMAAMDVVALPSVEHESLGMVLVEAMALGRPVVASRIGGPMEVITDGETGRLVPPRDPQALAEAIEDLLATDRVALGARAAADARARFAPEIFCQRVAQVYEDALRSRRSR
jgi:glycosyltransferase involved in cell wall biosynthesis